MHKLDGAKRVALDTGEAQNVEIAINDGDKLRWIEFHIDCDRDDNGNILGLVTTAIEISELKRREQVLKTLLREVSHRSKNLLAIVQSIASQTARFTDSIDDFLLKFRGRIQSLSYSQDLVTDSNWRGALFRDLVHSQVEKYIDVSDERLSIDGDNPYLFPGAALHVGLALHELVVNATSFGGLSIPYGRVKISAKVIHVASGDDRLEFRWEETNPAMPEVSSTIRASAARCCNASSPPPSMVTPIIVSTEPGPFIRSSSRPNSSTPDQAVAPQQPQKSRHGQTRA